MDHTYQQSQKLHGYESFKFSFIWKYLMLLLYHIILGVRLKKSESEDSTSVSFCSLSLYQEKT